jgi:hypothetical protein
MFTYKPKKAISLSLSAMFLLCAPFGPFAARTDAAPMPAQTDTRPFERIEAPKETLESLPVVAVARRSGLRQGSHVSANHIPGGTRYGFAWISDAQNIPSEKDRELLALLYETFVTAAERIYRSTSNYAVLPIPGGGTFCIEGRIDVSDLQISIDDIGINNVFLAAQTFLLDNPQYYMFGDGAQYGYDSVSKRLTDVTFDISPEYAAYTDRQAIQARVEQKYEEYAALVKGKSAYEMLRLVHDKMSAERDYSPIDSMPGESAYVRNILGVMDGTTTGPVDESFAKAYAYIINRLSFTFKNVSAILVSGAARINGSFKFHMWNIVYLNGRYYYLDPALDDLDSTDPDSPYYNNGGRYDYLRYRYFLVGRNNANWNDTHIYTYTPINKGGHYYDLPNVSDDDCSYVPGGTGHGLAWISDAQNIPSEKDRELSVSLYETFATAAEQIYRSERDYEVLPIPGGGTLCTAGRIDVSALRISIDDAEINNILLAVKIFLLDNPQYYMLKNGIAYGYDSVSGLITDITFNIPTEYVVYAVRKAIQARIEQKYEEYVTLVKGRSEYEVLRLVHDKMLAERDHSYINGMPDENVYVRNILGVMDHTTAGPGDESFAKAYAYIINRLSFTFKINVFVILVCGTTLINEMFEFHMWNVVYLDGRYYYLDPALDNLDSTDPNSLYYDKDNRHNYLKYWYFLVGKNNANWNNTHRYIHTPISEGGHCYDLPNVSDEDYTPPTGLLFLPDLLPPDGDSDLPRTAHHISTSGILDGQLWEKPLFIYDPEEGASIWNPYLNDMGSFVAGETPMIPLYDWTYDPSGKTLREMFENATCTPLTQGVDYTVTVESGKAGEIVRVWMYGMGKYIGVHFVIITIIGSRRTESYDIEQTSIIIEDGSTPYTVRTLDGTGRLLSDNINCSGGNARIHITDETQVNRIEVKTTRFVEIELENVNIDVSADKDACAFYMIPDANVRILVNGNNSIKSGAQRAGIEVPSGASLEILGVTYAQNTDILTATSASRGAGIGGADGKSAGSVLIRGATVKAYSGGWGAGIGGGAGGAGGLFFMDGGVVEAGSDKATTGAGIGQGAGLGGGYNGVGGTVFITSKAPYGYPKLLAYSSLNNEGEGAGIGGGANAGGGIVSINCHDNLIANGGGVEAYSSVSAVGRGAGIGGGFRGAGGTVVITDYNTSVIAAKSSGIPAHIPPDLAAAPGYGADIGAGFQNSNHGNQLILTRSPVTGDRVVGNVVLPDTILQYNLGKAFSDEEIATRILTYRISDEDKLVIPAGTSLRVPVSVTLINRGEIENYGNIYNDWRFDSRAGVIINKAGIWTSGTLFTTNLPVPPAIGPYFIIDPAGTNYIGPHPKPSSSAPAVPAPSNPSIPGLPSQAYQQFPAANHSVWVDYKRSGTTATLILTTSKTESIITASSDGTADIDLSDLDGVTETSFPRQALIDFADKGLDVEFRMPRGTVLLSRAAARDIAGQGNNTQIYMRFRPAQMQTLNAARRAALRDEDTVYELTMTVGGQNVYSFGGDIVVSVPYAGGTPVGAWYLDEKGQRKATVSSYENGVLRFTIRYFSLFAVGRSGAPAADVALPWYYVQ